jgi:signal transduction histidine kinase
MILLLAISFVSLSLHQQAMRSLVGERDERAVRAAAAAIQEQLNHRAAAVRGLSLRVMAAEDPYTALEESAFLAHDFEGGFAVFSADGQLLAAFPESSPFWQLSVVQQRLSLLAPTAVSQFFPVFTDPFSNGHIMLVAAQPENGLITIGAFFPDSLGRDVLGDIVNVGDPAAVLLTDTNGNILYQLGEWSEMETAVTQYPGIRDALRGDSGATYLDTENGEHVIAFSPIAPVNWALVIEEPWQAVTDPLLRASAFSPIILAPAILIAAVALWFGLRQVVQPLQKLEQQATQLGWGDFNAITAPVGGIEEIRRLQTELAHMAHKVQAAQQGLRGYLGAITTGQEEERRRLARELHDDTIQSLIGLNQRLQLAQLETADPTIQTRLAEMEQMATAMIAGVRRFIRDLRPIYLEDLGLVAALNMLAHDVSQENDIAVSFETTGSPFRLPPEVELSLYRIAQEGLSNIIRHAEANSARLQLCFTQDEIILTVSDNGRGFNIPDSPAEMTPSGHYGLLGMHERAELIGARLTIDSKPGEGTKLTVTMPVNKSDDQLLG